MTNPVTLHPMLASQVRNAKMKAEQIEAAAQHLVALMQEFHGQRWETCFCHDVGREFILIKPVAEASDA